MSEIFLHFGGYRIRLNGSGNLQARFLSLDNLQNDVMKPLPMSTNPGYEPLRYGNFVAQRARLELKTIVKGEIFKIQRIVVFKRPIWFDAPNII